MEKNIKWNQVKITGGFWNEKQITGQRITAHSLYQRFMETGRIDAMRIAWREGESNKPHIFWDSDVAKWIEGVAYVLYFVKDEELKEKAEGVIGLIEKAQKEDGYFNSYFLRFAPDERFTDRTAHELYTAGHLIEAAVAWYEATGETHFLESMERFADLIDRIFRVEESAPYKATGHEELELALFRLWSVTGKKQYLELAFHFINVRGTDERDRVFSVPNGTEPANPPVQCHVYYNDTYAQDDAPVRELKEAAGHAVRAMYLYAAMADAAKEFKDEELYNACKRLWDDSIRHKMYVTGGVSGDRFGEAIGGAYLLPNDTSYAETCASVAMAQFAQRMFLLDTDGIYGDIVELQMYNGALAGISIRGDEFFYDNPLEVRKNYNDFLESIHVVGAVAPSRRQKVFDCACCPPNIFRFIGSLGRYFYSVKDDTLFVHQYAESKANFLLTDKQIEVSQITDYPWSGRIQITINPECRMECTVAVRIPQWCSLPSVKLNNKEICIDDYNFKKGYLYLTSSYEPNSTIVLDFPMPVEEIEANPKLTYDCGKIVLKRGPVVYCVESIDNAFNIFDLSVAAKLETTEDFISIQGRKVIAIKGNGIVRRENCETRLYYKYDPAFTEVEFTAVPYFAWANRGKADMCVWLKKEILR